LFTESLHALTELLAEFPSLVQNSRFIFVPGPRDPGPGQILPRFEDILLQNLVKLNLVLWSTVITLENCGVVK
jgi:hypothetical protein